MLRAGFFIFCILSLNQRLWSQSVDTVRIEEIVVTATKTERSFNALPLPVQVIGNKEISYSKYAKLNNLLTEQSGLVVIPQINGLGNGIQVQGLNPDYTLIMIDGEPLIGRYTGSLELSRIAVGDIKKIEIVKGPSSSLYGSEALAGVINVISNSPMTTRFGLATSYNTNGEYDINFNTNLKTGIINNSVFINRFQSPGFDLSPNVYGQTVSPYTNYTFHHKFLLEKNKHRFSLSTRYFNETQNNEYQVVAARDSIKVFGDGSVHDFSVLPKYDIKINSIFSATAQCYFTDYKTKTQLKETETKADYYSDNFQQNYIKPEIQFNAKINNKHKFIFGSGWIKETVQTNRYGQSNTKEQNTLFDFIQHEWDINQKFTTITGLRFDYNSVYHDQWSPKFAVIYKVLPSFHIKASIGKGFKAPDFRQLYLNFNNAAAAYSVYGTEVVKDQLDLLAAQDQLLERYIDLNTLQALKAENSTAINIGLVYTIKNTTLDVNYFRNDLNNLIEVITAAQTKDNRFIYSYANLQKVYTQGIETVIKQTINNFLDCSFSYQLLYAKDKMVQRDVADGKIFGRNPVTLESYKIKTQEYFGLSNRSRHQATAKVHYHKNRWEASLRFIYRGKFGLSGSSGSVTGTSLPSSDINSNGILDDYDRFVKAYILANTSINYHINRKFAIQIGADNLFNHTDPINIPNLQGRSFNFNLQYQFTKSK